MSELDVASAAWLVSSEGLATVSIATRALDEGQDELAASEHLRRSGLTGDRATVALMAATARRRARELWPDADRLLFTREALEQASHPTVSAWRARRYEHGTAWDLCAGVGGDAMALGGHTAELVAVERDPARAVLLRHNLAVREVGARTLTDDALRVAVPPGCFVHVDPARRVDGRRARRLRDHVPPVPELLAAQRSSAGLGIVLSPAVDLADPDLPTGEVEFLQVGDRLVEAVAWNGELRKPGTTATATLLPEGVTRSRPGPQRPPRLPVAAVGDHLVEVAPAAVRARLHDDIGGEIGARRVSTRRALLTVDDLPPPSPWYRSRAVLAVLAARPKVIRRWLQRFHDGAVEVVLHGVDGDVERWWRELGRPPRGPDGVRIELLRLDRGAVALVTGSSTGDGPPAGRSART